MKHGFQNIRGMLNGLKRDQRGITGLETAIVLIAFVVVASVFAYAVITTGLFSSEKSQQSAQAGVTQAKSTVAPKGSMILTEAQSTGTATTATAANLTDAAASFVDEGVQIGYTVLNTSDGSSGIVTVVAAGLLTIGGGLSGGTENDWDIGETYYIGFGRVGEIKFKMTPSPGADPISLATSTTLVSFNDASNNENTTFAAAFPLPLVDAAYWNSTWLVGTGPGLEVGEVIEFTVSVKNLSTALLANKPFSVEVIPQTGAAVSYNRVTPLEMARVMDVN